tara:strand:- start:207 stop:626 length:420 start_codon:yes stop_codon:yes gene_type:complete
MDCQKIEVNARKSVFGFLGVVALGFAGYHWDVVLVLTAVVAAIAALVGAFIAVGYTVSWLMGEAHICQASRDAHEQKQEQEQLEYMKRQGADDKAIAWQVTYFAEAREEKTILAQMKKEGATKDQMAWHQKQFTKAVDY